MPHAGPLSMRTRFGLHNSRANKSTATPVEKQIRQPEDESTPQINQPIMAVSLEDNIC